jgi:integrase/recombinase XerD
VDAPAVPTLIRDYEKYLVRNTRAPNTLRTYRYASKDFAEHLDRYGVTGPAELGPEHIEGWMDTLLERGLKPGSRGVMAGWLRGFLRWSSLRTDAMQHNLWMTVGKVTIPPRLARPLESYDIRKIISYFNSLASPKPIDLRDKALFLTLFTSGLRISEVLQQRRSDAGRLSIVRQKGSKPRTLELHSTVQQAIQDYLRARVDDDPAMWVSFRSNRPVSQLDPAGVRELFRKVAKRAGVPRFTTHQLRHSTASTLFEQGVPEGVIADYLGHGDLDSVRGYIDTRNRRREAMGAMGRILEGSSGIHEAASELERLAVDLESVMRRVELGQLDLGADDLAAHAAAVIAALRSPRATNGNGRAHQAV